MTRPHSLVLFDIDGTLVDCGAASGRGFSKAFHEAFGSPCPIFPPEEVAGLTDSAILEEVVRRLNIVCDNFQARRSLAFEIYARNLALEFERRPARELPGANRAVQTARTIPGIAVGLLTGSTRATARIKLESAGIDFQQFTCGAYSEDAEMREKLPPVARRRFRELYGQMPNQTILIGDTPRDVHAAITTECEFIGVATGHYSRASLQEAGAQVILDDFTDPNCLRDAIQASCDRSRRQNDC